MNDIYRYPNGWKGPPILILKSHEAIFTPRSKRHTMKDHNKNYEILEFLGDSVLDTAVAKILYKNMPEIGEGCMTVIKSLCVRNIQLEYFTCFFGFDEFYIGEKPKGKVLADIFESYFGALLLERGFEETVDLLEAIMLPALEYYLAQYVKEKGGKRKGKHIVFQHQDSDQSVTLSPNSSGSESGTVSGTGPASLKDSGNDVHTDERESVLHGSLSHLQDTIKIRNTWRNFVKNNQEALKLDNFWIIHSFAETENVKFDFLVVKCHAKNLTGYRCIMKVEGYPPVETLGSKSEESKDKAAALLLEKLIYE